MNIILELLQKVKCLLSSIKGENDIGYKAYQRLLDGSPINIAESSNFYSITFSVVSGEADVNINGTTIRYPVGDVTGATFDGKIGSKALKGNIIITPTTDSIVLVTGIRKA